MSQADSKPIVTIKLGGNVLTSTAAIEQLAAQLNAVQAKGFDIVLVHGGGVFIDEALKLNGISVKKANGLRITDAATMAVVKQVLNQVNDKLAQDLEALGPQTTGCNSDQEILQASPAAPVMVGGEPVDLGLVGTVAAVKTEKLQALLAKNAIPVVAPIGIGPQDQPYNINADEAAAAIASALKAHSLLLVSDVPGVLVGTTEKTKLNTLTVSNWQSLIADGTVHGGMIPKLQTAFDALSNGVQSVQIIDGTVPDSITKAITHPGSTGTLIAA